MLCYNTQLVRTQLIPITAETFLESYKESMIKSVGECTEDDMEFVEEHLSQFMKNHCSGE